MAAILATGRASSMSDKGSIHHSEAEARLGVTAGHKQNLAAINEGEDEEAKRVLNVHPDEAAWTPEEERKLIRKIDLVLIPIMAFTIALQTTDKGLYGNGCVFGMCKDLELFVPYRDASGVMKNDTGRYSFASTIFYIGYLVGLYPLAFLAQRFPTAKMTGLYTLIWGIIMMMQPLCTNYQGAYAQRFFLGIAESGVSPAYSLITSMFYLKREQSLRLPLWYATGFVGLGCASFVSYGLVHINTGFAKWKILFLFYGVITVIWAVIAWIVLPDSPGTCRWFTEREKYIAVERLRSNQDSVKNNHLKKDQLVEVVLDIRVWLVVIITFLVLCPNGLTSTFIPVVVAGLGFNQYQSVILAAPAFFVSGFSGIFLGIFCRYTRNTRAIGIAITMLPCLTGCLLLWLAPRTNIPAQLIGVYFNSTFAGALSQVQAFIPSNTAGTTKKITASAMTFMAYSCGNIAGPLFMKAREAPAYPSGFKANTICVVLSLFFTALYSIACRVENKRRDKLGDAAHVDHAFEDQTDKQNLSFRYAL